MLSGLALSPGCSANTEMLCSLSSTCQVPNCLEQILQCCGCRPPVAHRIELVAAGLRAVCLGMCHAICKAGQQDQQNGNLHDLVPLVNCRRGRGEACSQAATAVACQLYTDEAGLRGLRQQLSRQQPTGNRRTLAIKLENLPPCLTQVNCMISINSGPVQHARRGPRTLD